MKFNKNQKLILAAGIYPPDIGGPSTYAFNLNKKLKEDYEIKIVTFSDNNSKDEGREKVTKITRQQNIWQRYYKYFRALYKLSDKNTIIYSFDLISTGIPAVLTKIIKPKTKIIIRIGGDFLWEKSYNNSWSNKPLKEYYCSPWSLKEKIYFKLIKFLIKRYDLLIFSTPWLKDMYQSYLGIENRSCVIENPFPELKLKESYNPKESSLLFAGRLIKLKNINLLIEAIVNIANVNLEIVGDGPEKQFLRYLVEKNFLKNRIKIFGSLSQKELFEKIKSTKIVVLPSISEVSPNLLLECIKLRKPIIVTQECGYFKKYKDNLIFFDPLSVDDLENKINFLLDKNNYQNYIEKISKINTDRSWINVSKEHKDLIDEL